MGATQEKVIREIKRVALKAHVDADFEFAFANTGHVYFRHGLTTVANMSFDFQTGSVTFALARGTKKASYFSDSLSKLFRIDYTDGAKFEALLREIANSIPATLPSKKV